jgi:hypothetical protein
LLSQGSKKGSLFRFQILAEDLLARNRPPTFQIDFRDVYGRRQNTVLSAIFCIAGARSGWKK